MPGAYTSTPIVVTPPNVPDGWDPDWPFPGVDPPGYDSKKEMSFVMAAPDTMAPTDSVSILLKLVRSETFATIEPDPGDSQFWAATLDGEPLLIYYAPNGWAYYHELPFTNVEGYWGAYPTFNFDLDDAEPDAVVNVVATGTPMGKSCMDDEDIDVITTRTAKFTVVITPPEFPPPAPPWTQYMHDVTIRFFEEAGVTSEPWARLRAYRSQHYYAPEWYYDEGASPIDEIGVWVPVDDGGSWILGTTAEGTVIIEALELESGVTYHVTHYYYALNTTTTYDLTLEVFEGETVVYSKTKQMIVSATDARTVWCTIDGTTGEITVITP